MTVSSPLIAACQDPAGLTAVLTAAAIGVPAGIGWAVDHRPEIVLSWRDGVGQVVVWRTALLGFAARFGLVLVAVELWVLELVIRPHGTHRREVTR